MIPEHPPEPADATSGPAADVPVGDPDAGAGLVLLDFVGTAALLVACVAGIVAPDGAGTFTAVASGVLFAVGVALFVWGYANGVVRSREEQITLSGLFFLTGTAPPVVRFRLRLALAVQVVLAVAAASIRPYTAVAFAVLAPMLGLGVMAAWGARHGTFHPRDDPRRP
ncbi:MAG TPA: hypothetical protein VFV42_11745 [Acidimicrobiales bacterium]|nr:hypothetical protein [Acidimicrobiales bacterium]